MAWRPHPDFGVRTGQGAVTNWLRVGYRETDSFLPQAGLNLRRGMQCALYSLPHLP